MRRNKTVYKKAGMFLLLTGIVLSCSDFVEIDLPRNEITTGKVFTDDASATSAIMGIYSEMSRIGFVNGSSGSVYVLSGLSGDEFFPLTNTPVNAEFFNNAILPENSGVNSLWGSAYTFIYYANSLLEGLEGVGEGVLSEEIRKQLVGEAKFIRAFCYFYLVNLFGDVPVITTTDFEINRIASRNSKEEVFQQIVMDLQDARELLAVDYSFSSGERLRPNRAVATAFLARVYLFTENWTDAEEHATEVIDNGLYHLVPALDEVFLANSTEAIWQLEPVTQNNTTEAVTFTPAGGGQPAFVSLTAHIISAFEEEDDRLMDWIGEVTTASNTFYYPSKYKAVIFNAPSTEYSMLLRLAEQYLIRAEARVRQGNILGGQQDLNLIRNRAGLENTQAATQAELLDAILLERRVELFSEGAHRWLDLKRTGSAGIVLGDIKIDWQPTDALYPIPQRELEINPNLAQNEGY